MCPFDHDPVWRVYKVYIKASAAALAAAEPLASTTKSSAPLTDLNKNSVDTLTTTIKTELYHKHRRAEATSAAQADRLPSPDSEIETEEEENNHTRTASLQDSDLPPQRVECIDPSIIHSYYQ